MTSEEIAKLAKSIQGSDPNTAIILLVLAGAKLMNRDGDLAELCQEFAKQEIYIYQYNKWMDES